MSEAAVTLQLTAELQVVCVVICEELRFTFPRTDLCIFLSE